VRLSDNRSEYKGLREKLKLEIQSGPLLPFTFESGNDISVRPFIV
jgi:hypothetical protein